MASAKNSNTLLEREGNLHFASCSNIMKYQNKQMQQIFSKQNKFAAGVKAWGLKSLGNLPSNFFPANKTVTRPISVFLVERGGGRYGRGLAVTKTNDVLLRPKQFYQSWTTFEEEQGTAVKTLFNTDVFVRFVISWVDLMGQF